MKQATSVGSSATIGRLIADMHPIIICHQGYEVCANVSSNPLFGRPNCLAIPISEEVILFTVITFIAHIDTFLNGVLMA